VATVASALDDFLARQDGSTESVIIEVAAPTVRPPTRVLGARGDGEPKRTTGTASKSAYDAVSHALETLHLSSQPVRLEELHSFVADVTSEQLRRIADLPMVAAIRPNRTRRAPRPKASRRASRASH